MAAQFPANQSRHCDTTTSADCNRQRCIRYTYIFENHIFVPECARLKVILKTCQFIVYVCIALTNGYEKFIVFRVRIVLSIIFGYTTCSRHTMWLIPRCNCNRCGGREGGKGGRRCSFHMCNGNCARQNHLCARPVIEAVQTHHMNEIRYSL